jgi:hypothetical protein
MDNVHERGQKGRSFWLALLLGGLAIFVSTLLLAMVVWPYGPHTTYDSALYLGGAVNMVHGHGISLSSINIGTGTLFNVNITHYPPLLSTLYAALMWMGVPYGLTPALVNLVAWVALLLGMGVLSYRLSGAPLLSALVVALAAVTHAYLNIFTQAMSEPLFLPLLVWLMVLLLDLPDCSGRACFVRLGGAMLLLTSLMLTRYVGVLALASVLVWWGWMRLFQRHPWRLLVEVPILGCSALPLAAWLVRNYQSQQVFVSSHFLPAQHTLQEGLESVVDQMTQLALPAMRPLVMQPVLEGKIWEYLSGLSYLLALLLLGGLLWSLRPQFRNVLMPPRSPLVIFLLFYLSLYTFIQPHMMFFPLDDRDVTSMLVLLQPWLFAVMVLSFPRWSYVLLTGLVALNVAIVAVPTVRYMVPHEMSLRSLAISDLRERRNDAMRYLQQGVPQWLIVWNWSRTRTIENNYPNVTDSVSRITGHVGAISNAPYVLNYAHHPDSPIGLVFSIDPMEDWLEHGTCFPRDNIAVIVFELPYRREDIDTYPPLIEEKCSGLPTARFDNSQVYRLDASTPAYEEGRELARAEQWQAAIDAYDAALADNPYSARAYADRARAYLALGEVSQALSDFDAALQQMPTWDALRDERAAAAAQEVSCD